ncbi:MAG TPA: NADPH-dependent F420 reductase [Chloroflexota bacterium]|nr:NADPH-dependent F420 reductase [Chloroflexota bacterium]
MPSAHPERPTLAFIGGTGPEGRGLAYRFALAGYPVVVGSRQSERAQAAAREIREKAGGEATGAENGEAAREGRIVILTVPYAGIMPAAEAIREAVAGKIVVSAIAPIEWVDGRPVVRRPDAGSAAEEVRNALGPEAVVVSAFQSLDSHQLLTDGVTPDTDVLVCSDHKEARDEVIALAAAIPGIRAYSAGRLASSRYVEECTALLITLNRIYRTHTGFQITGLRR